MKNKTDADTTGTLLASLPLFLGMSKPDISDAVTSGMATCMHVADGTTVAHDGDTCSRLLILAHGTISAVGDADDHAYRLEEQLSAPCVIQPERVFGLYNRYSRTFTTQGRCIIVSIDKSNVVKLSDTHQIFRINLLNAVSTQTQRLTRAPWRHDNGSLCQRLTGFISARCLSATGRKVLYVKRDVLAHMLHTNERYVADTLHQMREDGLLLTRRGQIVVEAMEKLVAATQNT